MNKDIVIFGGARDFHAVDWYRSVKKVATSRRVVFLTDMINAEGFNTIVDADDKVQTLFIIDDFLFSHGSKMSNIWRNLVKLLLVPVQVILLRRFVKKNKDIVLHAHPMYYMFLCWIARVKCGVTPQGSEILIRPNRSKVYRYFVSRSIRAAAFVTVDSVSMQKSVFELSGVNPLIIQNGIDTKLIQSHINNKQRSRICSVRGFTDLYRIDQIFAARNLISQQTPLTLIYPFKEEGYYNDCGASICSYDNDFGSVDKDSFYRLLSETFLTISIPKSDSSPRSVYEAIFAGSCVAAVYNEYMELLPKCMKGRIYIVDLENVFWLSSAIEFAKEETLTPYIPSKQAIIQYDQFESMQSAIDKIY